MKHGQVKFDVFSSSSNLGKFIASKERSSHKKESTEHYIHIHKNTILTFLYYAITLYTTTPFNTYYCVLKISMGRKYMAHCNLCVGGKSGWLIG